MTPCTAPRCSAPARWRVAGTDRTVCGEHIPDSTPVEPLPPPGVLAARCPPGWRRDPMTGRPMMPCLGKLLFPCEPHGLPPYSEIRRQLHELFDYTHAKPCWVSLIGAVLGDARWHKANGRPGLSQDTEKYLSDCIDEVLRFRGQVRIRKTDSGWEEVENG